LSARGLDSIAKLYPFMPAASIGSLLEAPTAVTPEQQQYHAEDRDIGAILPILLAAVSLSCAQPSTC
jgi:hypothetical protein